MKSAISTCLVAALLLPTSITAGPTCPKIAYGSNRVTCHVEIDQTDVQEGDHGHGHKHKHKNKNLEISRTIKIYKWSFFWNYIIKDDCPKTTAHLTSVLPVLGHTHHAVKCNVEVRWTPHQTDKHGNHYNKHGAAPANVSWDYAGHGLIDSTSLPAKMEWPLSASSDRPDHYIKPHELGVKYETANRDDMTTLEIHSGHGNDFSHAWAHSKHGHVHGLEGFEAFQGYNDQNNGIKGKDGHKHKDGQDNSPSVSKDHSKFAGHYNTKNLYSCWVFEKYHLASHQVTSEKGKHHGHHHRDHDDNNTAPVIPYHLPAWSTCEPHIPVEIPDCHEDSCDGDSCGPKNDDCESNSCGSDNCRGGSCNGKGEIVKDCHGGSCGDRQDVVNSCHGQSCGRRHEDCGAGSCHGDDCDGDDCGDDEPSNESDGNCEDNCSEDEGDDDEGDDDEGGNDDCNC